MFADAAFTWAAIASGAGAGCASVGACAAVCWAIDAVFTGDDIADSVAARVDAFPAAR